MQNSEKKILTINRLWSSITGVLKLLFEITYIYEVFYCEKEIQKYFLIKLTDGILPFEYHSKHISYVNTIRIPLKNLT